MIYTMINIWIVGLIAMILLGINQHYKIIPTIVIGITWPLLLLLFSLSFISDCLSWLMDKITYGIFKDYY